MVNVKSRIREILKEAADSLPEFHGASEEDINVMPAARPEFGDFSTNMALRFSKREKVSPQHLAGILCKRIEELNDGYIERLDIKNGFVNFFINPAEYLKIVRDINECEIFMPEKPCTEKKVLIEFVSANPTGPLTIAHGRQAAVGEALARILKFAGFYVQKEYYLNDGGRQIKLLGQSLKARYLQLKGEDADIPEEGYEGEYLLDMAKEISVEQSDNGFFESLASGKILEGIKSDLNSFGVNFDSWASETSFIEDGSVKKVIEELKEKGFLYKSDSSWWFKSSEFGDEKDRVVIKSDGSLTYLASDIAYHKNKIERGFDILVNILGPDHHGYIPRLKAAVEVFGGDPENFKPVIVQLTTLYRGSEKLSMSTRKGQFISLRQLIEEVGPDASKFFFLFRKTDSHLDFDLELAKKKTMDNPVFYLQYAYVRMKHILNFAEEKGINSGKILPDTGLLKEPEELAMAKKAAGFPDAVESVAAAYGVHFLAEYLLDLARSLHSYYQKHRVVDESNPDLTMARLYLVKAVFTVFSKSLELLNISLPESM